MHQPNTPRSQDGTDQKHPIGTVHFLANSISNCKRSTAATQEMKKVVTETKLIIYVSGKQPKSQWPEKKSRLSLAGPDLMSNAY